MDDKIYYPGIAEGLIQSLVLNTTRCVQLQSDILWEMIDLSKHTRLIYEWVQLPYAKTFWQMDHLSLHELHHHYDQMLNVSNATSLIGHWRGDPICQVELYDCMHDEISQHYQAGAGDIGLHFLMAPPERVSIPGISLLMMQSILSLVLENNHVTKVMGEPDIRNQKANGLVRKAGFQFIKQISMSYKEANLYACTRNSIIK